MIENIKLEDIYKVILSIPYKVSKYKKATIKLISKKGELLFQIEKFTSTQAFHENIKLEDLDNALRKLFEEDFQEIQVFTKSHIYGFRKTAKGKVLTNKNLNKEKVFVEVNTIE